MDLFQFLLLPFLAGLILTGIHAYLGVHVVERGVIFVDLSLAQIAALGSTIAVLQGYDVHGQMSYFLSLGFTIIGAAVFALTRVHRETRIPQEAIIGIVYAFSAAAAILAMSKATGETEHLKDMLVGNILSVDKATLIKTAILYSLVESAKRANVEPAAYLDLAARAALGGGVIPLPHDLAASL